VLPGQVRPPPAGDDRLNGFGPFRGGYQRRGGARTGAEQPNTQTRRAFIRDHPVGQRRHPGGEQADVESELRGHSVALFLHRSE
jgi:hypothetical protein